MAGLTSKTITSSYDQLIISSNASGGDTSTLVALQDGDGGTTFCVSMNDASTDKAVLSIDGSHANGSALYIDNSAADGDVMVEWQLSGTTTWLMGIEDGDNDSLKICHSNTMGTDERLSLLTASTVFNEDSADIDFRVESNGNTHMLFVDGGNDRVGIGNDTPDYTLSVDGEINMIEGSSNRLSWANSGGTRSVSMFGDSDDDFFIRQTSGDTGTLTIKGATGYVGIGDTAPDGQLTINQAGLDTSILTCKSSDVDHSITDGATGFTMEADTFFSITKAAGATGGATLCAIGEARTGFRLFSFGATAPDETTTTSGFGEFQMRAVKHDGNNYGTSATTHHGSDANLLTVHNGNIAASAIFIVKGDGDIYYDGADQGAYDSYDDAQLVRTMDTKVSPKDIIQSEWDDYIRYNEKTLVDAGLLGDALDKSKEETPLINLTGMQRLHNGAIWQQYTEMQKMKELMYETMVELMGKEKADKKLNSHDIKLLDKKLLD